MTDPYAEVTYCTLPPLRPGVNRFSHLMQASGQASSDTFSCRPRKEFDTIRKLTDTSLIKDDLILPLGCSHMALEAHIGGRVKMHRQSNHLTLKQLAEKVGCTDAYLSQIENGRVSPSIANLKKIAGRVADQDRGFLCGIRKRRTCGA